MAKHTIITTQDAPLVVRGDDGNIVVTAPVTVADFHHHVHFDADVLVEYSEDGETEWHPAPTASDNYLRISLDNGETWGDAWYLRGPQGEQGLQGIPGNDGSDGSDGADGLNGEPVLIRKGDTHIEWKYESDELWTELVALADLKGEQGDQGIPGNDGNDGADGEEVLLQKTETHIQWKYESASEWSNLVALADIKGDPGETGGDGADGDDGTDGNTWYSGSSDPSDESGNDGDFYLNTTSWDVFKKISGEWSLQGNIKGASGEGSGDVVGPEGATAGNLATFSGTSGKIIQDSGSKVADFEPAIGAKGTAFNKNFGSSAGDVCQGNDSRLSDARTPTTHGNDKHSSTYITGTTRFLNVVIDGGGEAIETGIKCDVVMPACTIVGAYLLADQSGSIKIDLWKDSYANFPPTNDDSICGGNEPEISTATKDSDTTLTDWTTSVSDGDIIRVNVDSCTTIERCTLSLKITT